MKNLQTTALFYVKCNFQKLKLPNETDSGLFTIVEWRHHCSRFFLFVIAKQMGFDIRLQPTSHFGAQDSDSGAGSPHRQNNNLFEVGFLVVRKCIGWDAIPFNFLCLPGNNTK